MSGIDQLKQSIENVRSIIAFPAPGSVKLKLADLGFFLQFIRPVWLTGLTSMVLVLFTTAISSLLPLSSKVFIDFVILKTGYTGIESVLATLGRPDLSPAVIGLAGSIDVVVAVMIVAALLYGAMDLLEKYLTAVYQQQITSRVQTSLFDHVLRFPISTIKNKQTGYLMSRVSNDVYTLQYTFSDGILGVIGSAFYIAFSVAIIFSLNSSLAIIIGLSIPVYLVLRYVFSGRIRGLYYREQELTAEVSSIMQEVISGAEVVKSYATEQREVARVSARLDRIARARISKYLHIVLAHSSMKGTMFLLLLFIMLAGARSIQGDQMTIGDYVTFITYIVFLSQAMNDLFYSYMNFQPAFASIGRLKEIFNIVPEWDDHGKALKKLGTVRGAVSFEDVSFAYDRDQPILYSISFRVKPGEKVALVGYSGAGKSTLVNLLLKLYVPRSGRICLDGVDIGEIDHRWLRRQISVVSQDIFLFNDTIENNIKYGKTTASREDVIGVARKAHIHDFIVGLPDGYDTLIGERGTKLSVGQRQRISIARAFLKDTPILILDEPTSAIDPETEAYLKDSLERLMAGKTTFIVSHRMSLTEIADKIIVIDRGVIAEYGTPTDLDKDNGIYHIMRTNGNAETNHLLKLR